MGSKFCMTPKTTDSTNVPLGLIFRSLKDGPYAADTVVEAV